MPADSPRQTSASAGSVALPGTDEAESRMPVTTWSARSVVVRVLAAVVAVAAGAGVWGCWRLFVDTFAGQHLERAAFDGATYGQGDLWRLVRPGLEVVPIIGVVGLVVAVIVALIRRRLGLALQVTVMVLGANVTTQLLKKVLFGRDNLIGGWDWHNTLPSGHTTLAASIAAAFVLVAPRAARGWVAVVGGLYAAGTGVSTLIGQWHRPGDAVAAALVVLAWSSAVCACTPQSAMDAPTARARWTVPAVTVLGVVALIGTVMTAIAAWRVYPAQWDTTRAQEITAYLGGASAVVASSAAAFATLLVVRQLTARRVA